MATKCVTCERTDTPPWVLTNKGWQCCKCSMKELQNQIAELDNLEEIADDWNKLLLNNIDGDDE